MRREGEIGTGVRRSEGPHHLQAGRRGKTPGHLDIQASSTSARTRQWTGGSSSPLDSTLLARFLKLKEGYQGVGTAPSRSSHKEPQPTPDAANFLRRVTWADQHGSPLCSFSPCGERQGRGARERPPTYKEVLTRGIQHLKHPAPRSRLSTNSLVLKNRCFRCLASDHQIRNCRDPLRCAACLRTGHRARQCRLRGSPPPSKMHRVGDFRPHRSNIFIPLSVDFRKRQLQRQASVLADVIGGSNLGHYPQETIAADLAAKFGGFSSDYLVAKFRERDFVILLPEWVRPEELIRNSLIRLPHCRLHCFPWEPYRHASLSRLRYKAWINLTSLPFECWSESCVSALVQGFGRFLRADPSSVKAADLTGFRCLIAIDDIADIPEHLSISMGDIIVPVSVSIESTAPFGGEDRGRNLARRPPVTGTVVEGVDPRKGVRSGICHSRPSAEGGDTRRAGGRRRPAVRPLAARPTERSVAADVAPPTAGPPSSVNSAAAPRAACNPRKASERSSPQSPRLGNCPLPSPGNFSNFGSGSGKLWAERRGKPSQWPSGLLGAFSGSSFDGPSNRASQPSAGVPLQTFSCSGTKVDLLHLPSLMAPSLKSTRTGPRSPLPVSLRSFGPTLLDHFCEPIPTGLPIPFSVKFGPLLGPGLGRVVVSILGPLLEGGWAGLQDTGGRIPESPVAASVSLLSSPDPGFPLASPASPLCADPEFPSCTNFCGSGTLLQSDLRGYVLCLPAGGRPVTLPPPGSMPPLAEAVVATTGLESTVAPTGLVSPSVPASDSGPAGSAHKAGSASIRVRRSPRLAKRPDVSVLAAAMDRKAALEVFNDPTSVAHDSSDSLSPPPLETSSRTTPLTEDDMITKRPSSSTADALLVAQATRGGPSPTLRIIRESTRLAKNVRKPVMELAIARKSAYMYGSPPKPTTLKDDSITAVDTSLVLRTIKIKLKCAKFGVAVSVVDAPALLDFISPTT